MYTNMEMWRDIRRRVLVEHESKRQICREYGIHFSTLQKILEHPEPPGYRQRSPRQKRKIGPFIPTIEEILKADKDDKVKKKQRHTAKRLFDRLVDEYGYEGGYTAVKEAVRSFKQRTAEVFVPLSHPPGWAQADFGQADIDLAGEHTKVHFFVMTLPFSDAFFVCAFERECTETFQEGHKRAFEFFEAVAFRISYDNSRIAVITVGKGRERKLTDEFLRLQSHYHFKEHFCLVRRPNEKGHVELLVGFSRRNFMVPIPKVDSIEQLNAHLEDRCRADLVRTIRGKDKPKGELLEDERASMLPLPKQRFEAHRVEKIKATSLSLARFDKNDYSAPTQYAHHPVTAIGTVEEVRLVVGTHLVATHKRCWKKHRTFYEPVHYLGLLERKPGALDFAAQPSVNKVLFSELLRCEYIDKRENILMMGNPGTGKTHLATALGMEACARGKKVRFWRVTELITTLMETREDRQLMRLRGRLAKLDLLILDELGYVPASKVGAELLFDIISSAYERTSIIVTTNLPFENWTEVLGSERLTGAVLDRLTHRCHIIEMTGESYRLNDAKRRRKGKTISN